MKGGWTSVLSLECKEQHSQLYEGAVVNERNDAFREVVVKRATRLVLIV